MTDLGTAVDAIYRAFAAGDIDAILEYIADDIAWECWADNTAQKLGVGWLAPRTGKAGAREFFEYIGRHLKVNEFQVLSVMPGDHQVAVEFVIEADIPETGARFRDEEMHLWTFNESGKVSRLRHYTDTAKHAAAWQHGRTHAVEV